MWLLRLRCTGKDRHVTHAGRLSQPQKSSQEALRHAQMKTFCKPPGWSPINTDTETATKDKQGYRIISDS